RSVRYKVTQGQQPASPQCGGVEYGSVRCVSWLQLKTNSARTGREAALGGSTSTGDRAYAAGWVSHPIRCVARRGGPAVYSDGHFHTHCWTPFRRILVPIPIDLRRHGSARYDLIGHASSLRAIDIFFLTHYFEARRALESQGHDLLRGGSSIFILLAARRIPRSRVRPGRRHTLRYPYG